MRRSNESGVRLVALLVEKDEFEQMDQELREKVLRDAQHDIGLAKDMIDEALTNLARLSQPLSFMSEERRVAQLAREILNWGDEGGIAVVAAVAILRLGGFK